MALLDITTLRALVETDLTDVALQIYLDDAEAAITRQIGPTGDLTVTLPVSSRVQTLFLSRRASSVATVKEIYGTTETTVDAANYALAFGGRAIQRFYAGAVHWWGGQFVQVAYTPIDDTSIRKRVQLDLVRLAMTYRGMVTAESEGERSDSSSLDYERERDVVLRGLQDSMGVAA